MKKQWFDLVKCNFRKVDPDSTEVVHTVQGLWHAQQMASMLTDRLTPEEKEAGISVFWRKVTKPAGL